MKKITTLFVLLLFVTSVFSGCSYGSEKPHPDNPVTLTMWHVYGSQTKSPLNAEIEKFNSTIGKEEGIIINVVSVTSSSEIDKALSASATNQPGAEELPDLFTAYPRVAELVGKDLLLPWNDYFSDEELSEYNEDFLSEGYFGDKLLILPIAKSSEVFYLNKTLFDKFSAPTGYSVDDLKTFDGLFDTANAYYDWSGGQNFTQINDFYHYSYIGMKTKGDDFIKNGKPDLNSPAFEQIWTPLAKCAIYGGICLEDGYAAARWKTVEIISNVGSTADVLYQPDSVIYPDNTTESILSVTMPYPLFDEAAPASVHRGGGLFAVKSEDERKNYAAYVFAKWLTNEETNIDFVTSAGYLPVKKNAFNLLSEKTMGIENESYQRLYTTFLSMYGEYELYSLPLYDGASQFQQSFEENVKIVLKSAHRRFEGSTATGEDRDALLTLLAQESLSELRRLCGNYV